MLISWVIWMFMSVLCCSGGLYAVQEGYTDVQEGCILFRGFYAVHKGYMLFRRVIWMLTRVVYCSGGLHAV